MRGGLPWSDEFIRDLSEKDFRDEFVADQIRTRLALLIRALREQPGRNWSQSRLGQEMGKPQSVISRLEDPDYGKQSLQTLLEVAAAFDLPLWVDIPEWDEWLMRIKDIPNSGTKRNGFDAGSLINASRFAKTSSGYSENVIYFKGFRKNPITTANANSVSQSTEQSAICYA